MKGKKGTPTVPATNTELKYYDLRTPCLKIVDNLISYMNPYF